MEYRHANAASHFPIQFIEAFLLFCPTHPPRQTFYIYSRTRILMGLFVVPGPCINTTAFWHRKRIPGWLCMRDITKLVTRTKRFASGHMFSSRRCRYDGALHRFLLLRQCASGSSRNAYLLQPDTAYALDISSDLAPHTQSSLRYVPTCCSCCFTTRRLARGCGSTCRCA